MCYFADPESDLDINFPSFFLHKYWLIFRESMKNICTFNEFDTDWLENVCQEYIFQLIVELFKDLEDNCRAHLPVPLVLVQEAPGYLGSG